VAFINVLILVFDALSLFRARPTAVSECRPRGTTHVSLLQATDTTTSVVGGHLLCRIQGAAPETAYLRYVKTMIPPNCCEVPS